MSKMFIPVLKEASRWGPGGPYIIKPYQLAKEIAKHLDTDNATKDEVDFFADRLLDKIESALMYYQLIVADEFEGRDISQKRTIYEGLYANLWSFYKSRAQNYLNKMGWDIGFFFCKEKDFEKQSNKFIQENPEHKSIVNYAKKQRDGWQAEFALSRNVAEHSGDYRDGAKCYENPDEAKHFFAQVCWSVETMIAYFGSYKMLRTWNVSEVEPDATIFDSHSRFIVEHALETKSREGGVRK
jgi:hypothetical protein